MKVKVFDFVKCYEKVIESWQLQLISHQTFKIVQLLLCSRLAELCTVNCTLLNFSKYFSFLCAYALLNFADASPELRLAKTRAGRVVHFIKSLFTLTGDRLQWACATRSASTCSQLIHLIHLFHLIWMRNMIHLLHQVHHMKVLALAATLTVASEAPSVREV